MIEDNNVYSANVGDSKALLFRNRKARKETKVLDDIEIIPLTIDHKPNDTKE